jgi:hypothetical protein
LPDEQRAGLLLVGVEGLSLEEAARVLGVLIGTAMSRLSRGCECLRCFECGELDQIFPLQGGAADVEVRAVPAAWK